MFVTNAINVLHILLGQNIYCLKSNLNLNNNLIKVMCNGIDIDIADGQMWSDCAKSQDTVNH